jgi:hypothetical protein
LYKEDFEKFMDGLNESIQVIRENAPATVPGNETSDGISFDDLGN